MAYIFLIAFLPFIILFFLLLCKNFNSKYYVISLLVFTSVLIFYIQIISTTVLGIDSHYELITAKITLDNSLWSNDVVNNYLVSALSISMYTPIISIICNVDINFVLKYVFCIYPVLSILIIWEINYKIFEFTNRENFLSLLLLIGTCAFQSISMYGRMEPAYYCALLVIYCILSIKKSKPLIFVTILLFFGLIVSHYTTAIIFIVFFVIASLVVWFLSNNVKSFDFVLISVSMAVMWLLFICHSMLLSINSSLLDITRGISNVEIADTTNVVQEQLNPVFKDIFYLTNYYINITIVLLILIGSIYFLFNVNFLSKTETNLNIKKYSILIFLFAFAIIISILPHVSVVYNAERIYLNALIFCNGIIIISLQGISTTISKYLSYISKNFRLINFQQKLYNFLLFFFLLIVMSHLVLQVGIPQKFIEKYDVSKYLEDPKDDLHYFFENEVYATIWIKKSSEASQTIIVDSFGRGTLILRSYGLIEKTRIWLVNNVDQIRQIHEEYIFYKQKSELSKNNIELQKIIHYSEGNNKIYSSGSPSIYYFDK